MDNIYLSHPVIVKARELSDSICQTEAFKEKNIAKLQVLIKECNQIIAEITNLNYGSICQPRRSGCCG